ncbi:MAG: calcium-binding protein [Blastochloris sp.]|nr:calcium-binding protein [Blastochloris sp.]
MQGELVEAGVTRFSLTDLTLINAGESQEEATDFATLQGNTARLQVRGIDLGNTTVDGLDYGVNPAIDLTAASRIVLEYDDIDDVFDLGVAGVDFVEMDDLDRITRLSHADVVQALRATADFFREYQRHDPEGAAEFSRFYETLPFLGTSTTALLDLADQLDRVLNQVSLVELSNFSLQNMEAFLRGELGLTASGEGFELALVENGDELVLNVSLDIVQVLQTEYAAYIDLSELGLKSANAPFLDYRIGVSTLSSTNNNDLSLDLSSRFSVDVGIELINADDEVVTPRAFMYDSTELVTELLLTNTANVTFTTPAGVSQMTVTGAKIRLDRDGAWVEDTRQARVATTGNLNGVYNATDESLTGAGNLNSLGIDGVTTLREGDFILVKNQTDSRQNGYYIISEVGDNAPSWQLLRTGGTVDWAEQPAAVRALASTPLPATFNAVAGTLTANADGSLNNPGIDGITNLVAGEILLVRNQTNAAANGYYTIVDLGGASSRWVLKQTAVPSVRATSSGSLAATYDDLQGRLTATALGSFNTLAVGGITNWAVGQNVLINGQTSAVQNGIYRVLTLGDASTAWVLERAGNVKTVSVLSHVLISVTEGGQAGKSFKQPETITELGVQSINFVEAKPAEFRLGLVDGRHYLPWTVYAATTQVLNASYDNGNFGVGATLVGNVNGGIPAGAFDGIGLLEGDRVLVKNQTDAAHNGVYVVTDFGDANTPYILTRVDFADEEAELDQLRVLVEFGRTHGLLTTAGDRTGEAHVFTLRSDILNLGSSDWEFDLEVADWFAATAVESFVGGASARLPISISTPTSNLTLEPELRGIVNKPLGSLEIYINNFNDPVNPSKDLSAFLNPVAEPYSVSFNWNNLPRVYDYLGQVNILDKFRSEAQLFIESLEYILFVTQSLIDVTALEDMPVIDTKLADYTGFIQEFRSKLTDALRNTLRGDLLNPLLDIETQINNVLGPASGGLDFLLKTSGGAIDPDAVQVLLLNSTGTVLPYDITQDLNNPGIDDDIPTGVNAIEFVIKLRKSSYYTLDSFKISDSRLQVGTENTADGVTIELDFAWDLRFGVDLEDGFYIKEDADANPNTRDLQIDFRAYLDANTGNFGPDGRPIRDAFTRGAVANGLTAVDVTGATPLNAWITDRRAVPGVADNLSGTYGKLVLDFNDTGTDGRVSLRELQGLGRPSSVTELPIVTALHSDSYLDLTIAVVPSSSSMSPFEYDYQVFYRVGDGVLTFGGESLPSFVNQSVNPGGRVAVIRQLDFRFDYDASQTFLGRNLGFMYTVAALKTVLDFLTDPLPGLTTIGVYYTPLQFAELAIQFALKVKKNPKLLAAEKAISALAIALEILDAVFDFVYQTLRLAGGGVGPFSKIGSVADAYSTRWVGGMLGTKSRAELALLSIQGANANRFEPYKQQYKQYSTTNGWKSEGEINKWKNDATIREDAAKRRAQFADDDEQDELKNRQKAAAADKANANRYNGVSREKKTAKRIYGGGINWGFFDPVELSRVTKGQAATIINFDLPTVEFRVEWEFIIVYPLAGVPKVADLFIKVKPYFFALVDFDFGISDRGFFFQDLHGLAGELPGSSVANSQGPWYNAENTGGSAANPRNDPNNNLAALREGPEFVLGFGLEVKAGITLFGIVEIGVGFDIQFRIEFDWHDTDNDGKMFFDEIVGLSRQGFSPVDIAFVISGKFFIYVRIVIDFGFFTRTIFEKQFELYNFSFRWEITEMLFSYNLGSLNSGVLTLNVGDRAPNRLYNQIDNGEVFVIATYQGKTRVFYMNSNWNRVLPSSLPNDAQLFTSFTQGGFAYLLAQGGKAPGGFIPNVTAFNDFTGVSSIIINSKLGNDYFDLSLLTGNIAIDFDGGVGNDTLIAPINATAMLGSGRRHVLRGGEGNDDLRGATNDLNTIEGGKGNDVMTGGSLGDILDGGEGRDSMTGGAGNDTYIFANKWGRDSINEFEDGNILDFSTVTNNLTFRLGAFTASVQSGNDVVFTNTANSVNRFIAGTGNDVFAISAFIGGRDVTLVGGNGGDTYDFLLADGDPRVRPNNSFYRIVETGTTGKDTLLIKPTVPILNFNPSRDAVINGWQQVLSANGANIENLILDLGTFSIDLGAGTPDADGYVDLGESLKVIAGTVRFLNNIKADNIVLELSRSVLLNKRSR